MTEPTDADRNACRALLDEWHLEPSEEFVEAFARWRAAARAEGMLLARDAWITTTERAAEISKRLLAERDTALATIEKVALLPAAWRVDADILLAEFRPMAAAKITCAIELREALGLEAPTKAEA